ncbi:hypothetical protein BN133_48 [Cronobacter dublinensis 582]|nr:hypothetical protein BN133_48 [Cronobacter dublinensis 582]
MGEGGERIEPLSVAAQRLFSLYLRVSRCAMLLMRSDAA